MTLSFEIIILLVTTVWTISLTLPPFIARLLTPNGISWGLSNRDYEPKLPAWHGRANRAHSNMTENLIPFAIIVCVAQLGGVSNEWTQGGALSFLIFRILHAICYITGLVPWRTHAFNLSIAAEAVILFQIIKHGHFG